MNGERKAVLFTVGFNVFCLTVVAVLVFASLWPQRQVVAWVLLVVFGSLALILIASKVDEMSICHHYEEKPLGQEGNPTHLKSGEQVYERQSLQPKESYIYER
jgi:hypothetical protein